jgi:hypothetical protein
LYQLSAFCSSSSLARSDGKEEKPALLFSHEAEGMLKRLFEEWRNDTPILVHCIHKGGLSILSMEDRMGG